MSKLRASTLRYCQLFRSTHFLLAGVAGFGWRVVVSTAYAADR
jgi:hypothetical protein